MHGPSEEQHSPPFEPSEQQALATLSHAAEEMRFFKGQQWRVTNYALFAYAALAAAPSWVEPVSWQSSVSWVALGLVWVTAAWTIWILMDLEASVRKERRRLIAAREHLPFIREIHKEFRLKDPSQMPWRRGFLREPQVKPVLFAAVLLGALVASLIILSRIPYVQHVVACISQSTSGGSWPVS